MGLLDLHQTDAALEYCRKLLQIQVAEVSEYRSTDSIDGKFFRTTVRQFEISCLLQVPIIFSTIQKYFPQLSDFFWF